MTTQTLARLIIATAALALALLLFSERMAPAAKADKPAPKADIPVLNAVTVKDTRGWWIPGYGTELAQSILGKGSQKP